MSIPPQPYQVRVYNWATSTFGPTKANDRLEREWRFIEEALELVQSFGVMSEEDCHKLVSYVYGRPKGSPDQELGGTMTTLALLAQTHNLNMEEEGEIELARINTPQVRAKIQAKQQVKSQSGLYTHQQGPLPGQQDTTPSD